ncbi:MAG: nitroreductase family deazaflavin-dependent oxidoreductase [Candidatus Eremiobacterota bacterium]
MNAKTMADITRFFLHRRSLMKLMTGFHVLLYRVSGGMMGGMVNGVPNLLVTTRGRKSGKRFTTPLFFLTHDGAFAVVASYGGSPQDPGWWKNLQHNPLGEVQVGPHRIPVRAEAATPELKARLWPLFARLYPAYDEYQKLTDRSIPIILLRPVDG